jgi:hypothetical protein
MSRDTCERCPATSHSVELGGIEPPSVEWMTTALRPFPWTTACRLPYRRVGWPHEEAAAGSFPGASGLSRRQRSFPPSTIASVARLRWSGPACHFRPRPLSCHLMMIRRRGRTALAWSWQLCWLPRLRSLSNSGRTIRLPVSTSKPISPLSSSRTSVPVPTTPTRSCRPRNTT